MMVSWDMLKQGVTPVGVAFFIELIEGKFLLLLYWIDRNEVLRNENI